MIANRCNTVTLRCYNNEINGLAVKEWHYGKSKKKFRVSIAIEPQTPILPKCFRMTRPHKAKKPLRNVVELFPVVVLFLDVTFVDISRNFLGCNK